MEEIFKERASQELGGRVLELAKALLSFSEFINAIQFSFLLGSVNIRPEVFAEFMSNCEIMLSKMTEPLPHDTLSELTQKVAFDFLFAVQDAIPMAVEIDKTLAEMDFAVLDKDGRIFSDYLKEAVKI